MDRTQSSLDPFLQQVIAAERQELLAGATRDLRVFSAEFAKRFSQVIQHWCTFTLASVVFISHGLVLFCTSHFLTEERLLLHYWRYRPMTRALRVRRSSW